MLGKHFSRRFPGFSPATGGPQPVFSGFGAEGAEERQNPPLRRLLTPALNPAAVQGQLFQAVLRPRSAAARVSTAFAVASVVALLVMTRFDTDAQDEETQWMRNARVSWMRLWLPRSKCLTLPGITPVDESPIRSPLLIADHLIEYASEKTFMEVGTRNGDISACVAQVRSAHRHALLCVCAAASAAFK